MRAAGDFPPACLRHGGKGAALSTLGAAPVSRSTMPIGKDVNQSPLDVLRNLKAVCLRNG